MPFTLSHPAAVIPLARGPLVPSALVIGSMAPDIPYFFFMMELRRTTHRPLGMVTVDLLLGLLLYAMFHLVWKAPLIALSPEAIRRRLPVTGGDGSLRRPSSLLWVPVSLLAGITTHVCWDAFTHSSHGFAGLLPWLVTVSFGGMQLFRWLQYLSGVLGFLLIGWWLLRWARSTPAGQEPAPGLSVRARLLAGASVAAGAAAGGSFGAITLAGQPDLPRTFHMTLVSGVVGIITGAVLAVTGYALWWRTVYGRRVSSSVPSVRSVR